MFGKFRYRLGYESLCAEVSDSISWRRFCRIPLDAWVPHPTTLMKLTTRCGEAAVAGLNEALLAKAAEGKLLRTAPPWCCATAAAPSGMPSPGGCQTAPPGWSACTTPTPGRSARDASAEAASGTNVGPAAPAGCRARLLPPGLHQPGSGSHRYVLDYLAEEVLERQPEHVRTFLLETSVLGRLSGELCDAVTGSTGGQALLEALERANLFLMPLDEVRGWWRYHHLFADLLHARLRQEQPGKLPRLHRAAAGWYEAHRLADEEHLVLARLLLAQDRTGEALALLERWLAAAAACCRTGSILQFRTLLALALAANGDQARALTARELEVLRLLAVGRSNQSIARELVVVLDTVEKARQPRSGEARRG